MYTTPWSDDEIQIVRAHYPVHGPHWAGWEMLLPARSERSIMQMAHRLKLKSGAKVKPKKRKPTRRILQDNHRIREVQPTPDPHEPEVIAMMAAGMTPSEIDAKMHWYTGTARLIMSERWEREKNDGD